MTAFLAHHAALYAPYLVDIPSGYNPNSGGIPGAGTLMDVTNWAAFLVLGLCVLGLILSIAGMVVGKASGNAGIGILGALALPVFIVGVILTVNAYNLLNAFAHLQFH
jgi:hypothetical protein